MNECFSEARRLECGEQEEAMESCIRVIYIGTGSAIIVLFIKSESVGETRSILSFNSVLTNEKRII
jgi:hypothetical protein